MDHQKQCSNYLYRSVHAGGWLKGYFFCLTAKVTGDIAGSGPQNMINTFLQPLVQELKLFWEGQTMKLAIKNKIQEKIIRCALLCGAWRLACNKKNMWIFIT